MLPGVQALNGILRRVPVWPGYVLGFVPAVSWFYLALTGGLGPDPARALEHELGLFALQLLIATLAVTPLLRVLRLNLMRFRRMIGLMALYYALLHVSVYVVFDVQFDWAVIFKDLTKRPYIIAGALALVLLIPLGLTSNDWSVRRLGGAAWRNLHRLVYPAAALGAIHYVWLVKSWPPQPLAYAAVVGLFLGWRAIGKKRSRIVPRQQQTAS